VRTHTNSFMWGLVVLAVFLVAGALVTLATRRPATRIARAVT